MEALLEQELPISRELLLERQHVTTPVTFSVILSVHRSLSPPTDHSGGEKSLSPYIGNALWQEVFINPCSVRTIYRLCTILRVLISEKSKVSGAIRNAASKGPLLVTPD